MLSLFKNPFVSFSSFNQGFFNKSRVITDENIIQGIEKSNCHNSKNTTPYYKIVFKESGQLKVLSTGSVFHDGLHLSRWTLLTRLFHTKVFIHKPTKVFIFFHQQ